MDLLWVSNAVLWVVVLVLAVLVLALARQVGLLHERIAPAGALSPTGGPKVGEQVPPNEYAGLRDDPVVIGGADAAGRATLVLFTSPTCPVCRELVPVARSLARRETLRLVFASDGGTAGEHARYAAAMGLDSHPYVLSRDLGLQFGVSRLPFAVLIGADGALAARGLVNSREHLESLLESMRSGVESLQDYLAMEQRP
jgi:methylamine dehydrogenase accessory protein MauD